MNKLFLILAFTVTRISVDAQGTVGFFNTQSTRVRTSDGDLIPAGTTFTVNLYYNSSSDPLNPPEHNDFTPLGFAVGFLVPGRYNGGIRTTPLDTPPGGAAWFQVRVWQTAYGATYEEVRMNPEAGGRGFGISNPLFQVTGTDETLPPHLGLNPAFTGVTVDVVPEPSTVLLAVLGMAGLLVLQQRKSL